MTAKQLVKNFYEVVAAPNYDKKALEILKARKNLRVLKVRKFTDKIEKRSIFAGTLIQDVDNKKSSIETICGVNKLKEEKIDFFINVLKFIKSNAIAIFNQTSLIAQSGGQTSRVDSLKLIKTEKFKVSIYAPLGSINDSEIKKFVKKNNLNFFKLSDRHFKH